MGSELKFNSNLHLKIPPQLGILLVLWMMFPIPTAMAPLGSIQQIVANPSNQLAPQQKLRTEQLISLFENSTLDFQYGYAEVLGDGRGVTAGRAGFTTGTGDAYEVVKQYTDRVPHNPLARYLPELKRLLTAADRDDVSKLGGFIRAWRQAAQDPLFRAIQDRTMEEMYYLPALAHAQAQGARLVLSRSVLYDTIIQHGNGYDPDSLSAILKETQQRVGGNPKIGIDEKLWLKTFLKVRRSHLAYAHNRSTRKAWARSVTRVDVWSAIADSGNYHLAGPIKIRVSYYNTTIP
jgi:chitosanase